jgi:hypothetical protein
MAEITLERIAELRGIATVCIEDGERWSIGPKELLRILDAAETLAKLRAIVDREPFVKLARNSEAVYVVASAAGQGPTLDAAINELYDKLKTTKGEA